MDPETDLDAEALLRLARDKSTAGRGRLVEVVGDLVLGTGRALSDRERALISEILRHLIHDVEMSVRRALADRLARIDDVPHDLITTLANDDAEVARPILIESNVLQDVDLIEIIQHRTFRHQLAITMRAQLTETVSDALVKTGNTDVIKALIENPNADISRTTMAFLVEESRRVDKFQNPLVDRADLDPALAKRMYWWVSAAVRKHILECYEFDPADLEDALEDTVHDLISDQSLDDTPVRKAQELAKRLKEEETITPAMLVDSLRQGEVTLFEDLFAELAGLRPTLVRRFIYEPGGEGLAITAKALAMDKSDLAAIFLLSRQARPGEKVVDPAELSSVMAFFDRIKPETARKVVKRWRRDPDFLFALKQVDSAA